MIKTYLKIAIRILWHNKVYVGLNLVGLGFAIACCMMAFLNYNYRSSFDLNHTGTENIYRLNSTRINGENKQPWAVVPASIAKAIQMNEAGIERIARIIGTSAVVKLNNNSFNEHIHYADKTLFEFFNLPLKQGNLGGFKANEIVISDVFAKKHFPSLIPIGKQLTVVESDNTEKTYIIGAVMQKIPTNSSFQFDIISSFQNDRTLAQSGNSVPANTTNITTFVEVKNEQITNQIAQSFDSYLPILNKNRTDWTYGSFYLQPFKEIAKSSDVDMPDYVYGSQLNANPRGVLVIIPAIMSFIILLITCFNFTNISIAFASGRLKEIGIRKVIGGVKSQLVSQFMTENLILSFIGSFIALLFVGLFLPSFNQITALDLALDFGKNYGLWLFLLIMPVITALFSGLYPAFYISSFQPIKILKGKTTFGSSNRFTRILLVGQFSLSCFAMVVGIILTKNADFQEKVDFGYEINEVAVVGLRQQQYNAFSQAILTNPQVKYVGGTTHQIGEDSYSVKAETDKQQVQAQVAHVGGEAYLNSMGVKLVQGRHFHKSGLDTDESIIVNKTLLQQLALKNPLGERIKLDSAYFTIVGVVNDYKEYGLHGLVPPCILRLAKPENYKYAIVRANEKDLPQTAKYLEATWHKLFPNLPYYGFLQSDLIEKEIRLNQGFKSVALFLAIITLLLSASGLFALISLSIDKRSKEIGMRKVLGASMFQILGLINLDFIKTLLISFVLGSTLGYLFINKLIFQFIYKYHTEAGFFPYVCTFFIIFISCGFIIGTKVYRAANNNPIHSMKTD